MAFKNGLSERLEELRFSSPRSPTSSDSPFSSFPSPPRGQTSFMSAFHSPPAHDVRANLHRRFTTDSSRVSPFPALNQHPPLLPDTLDLLSSATHLHKSQLFEKKRQHIEYMREQRRRFEADMKLLDLQQAKERQEMDQLARDLAQAGLAGPVSEPTTPPDYHDTGFPTPLSRPSRFSTSSATNPGVFNLLSSSQLVSPAANHANSAGMATTPKQESAPQSMLGSRRNSEEDHSADAFSAYRPSMPHNRYSMPTTGFNSQLNSNTNGNGFNNRSTYSFNAAKYLFHNDDNEKAHDLKDEDRIPTPDVKSYLRLTDPDDKFPTLVRGDGESGVLSANSAALDLANSRTPQPDTYIRHGRHHSAHQSLGQVGFYGWENDPQDSHSGHPRNGSHSRHMSKHSDVGFSSCDVTSPNGSSSATNGHHHRPTSLQMSYSTNDIPTTKTNGGFNTAVTPPSAHADYFQGQTASAGRVPPTSQAGRHQSNGSLQSPLSSDRDEQTRNMQPLQSALQASAAPFGPHLSSPASISGTGNTTPTFPNAFYGYGVQPFVPNALQANGQTSPFGAQNSFSTFAPSAYAQYPRFPDSPARQNPNRRSGDGETGQFSRFSNVPLEQYQGELYGLCKDQHGCRYLQRKLEEQNPAHVQMIFMETHMHVVELMTDPFGNYLCQKLLEYSNDDQRTALISHAASQLVKIALNQHGTRALQKMIEFISTPEQTQMVINALRDNVVELVQDLNGNHVIQKCLNRLSAPDAQFIYDSVGASCVAVGTHRHGCCVLQRCIDHASGEQKARLIDQITKNAFTLVQDPFGNYVVQYILDLAEPHFIEPICQNFRGNIATLSKQKFSSNVIEKCIRTADVNVRRLLVEEMLVPSELDKMLRDSFANYVVQTAMDFADPETRVKLIDAIRPILPAIRQTPHGRRIAGKIMAVESQGLTNGAISSGQMTPNDAANDQTNSMYHHVQSFPNSVITQFTQQYGFSDGMANNATGPSNVNGVSTAANGSSALVNDDASTTIYSPIPQQANGINGLNGLNGSSFSFY